MKANDPKVTTFLLGETEALNPEELAEVEAFLVGDPQGEEIRQTARLLREGFAREKPPRLREEQRERLRREAEALFLSKDAKPALRSRFARWNEWIAAGRRSYPFFWASALAVFLLALFILRQMGPFFPPPGRPLGGAVEENAGSTPMPAVADSPSSSPEALPPDIRARFEEPSKAMATNVAPGPIGRLGSPRMPAWVLRERAAGLSREAKAGTASEGEESSTPPVGLAGGAAKPYSRTAVPIIGDLYTGARQGEAEETDRGQPGNRNAIDAVAESSFLRVRDHPLSAFSADVDLASYAIVRRYLLEEKKLPPKGAVQIEQLINYFPYDDPSPQGSDALGASIEAASCPWAPKHRLVRIGIKARELPSRSVPPNNLVFLIDVSGSMNEPNKLPLLQKSLDYLIDQLGAEDRVGIVVYAGASGCVLLPTGDKKKIREAVAQLRAGGPTNGTSGIEMAYELAERNFFPEGNNRVILVTDGNWNIGATSQSELLDRIAEQARKKIYLTVLGFGMGNLNDSMLVKLADRGNGNYAYIDTLPEAHNVFGEALRKILSPVAKDVKLQVEFNPRTVSAYRLLGYEKRLLAEEEFKDDATDAGEVGAGQTLSVLYEIIPAGEPLLPHTEVDPLKYQPEAKETDRGGGDAPGRDELFTLKIRYKKPGEEASRRVEFPFTDSGGTWEKSSAEFRFAAAVAAFGELLRNSPFKGESSWRLVSRLAEGGLGKDPHGYRSSFLELVKQASSLEAEAKRAGETK